MEFRRELFRLVLVDVMVPKIDGFELLRLIRSNLRTKELPGAVVTSFSRDKHAKHGRDLGANHYIMKPLMELDFLKRLAHMAPQALRHFDEEGVARGVPVAVVDLLEAVEVDEHAGDLAALAPGALDGLVERRREAHAVGEAGERIAVGERGDALAGERDLGHVAPDAAVADEAAARVVVRLAAHREIACAAVGGGARHLEVAERQPALERRLVRLPAGMVGTHRRDLPRRLADQGIADRRRRRARAVHQAREAVLRIALPEEIARQLRQAPEARLAQAQRLFGIFPLQELAEKAADGGRRLEERLVGLAPGGTGEGEHRDRALARDHRDGKGTEAAALRARQVGGPYRLARLPQDARAAQQLLDLAFAREPAFGVGELAVRRIDAEAASGIPVLGFADEAQRRAHAGAGRCRLREPPRRGVLQAGG